MATSTDQRAVRSVAIQFFVNGAAAASFVPRLPEIRDTLEMSVADVGLLLTIAGATGLVLSVFVTPSIERFGTRAVISGGGVVLAAALGVIGVANSQLTLLAGLMLLMTVDVPVDVGMNMQASWLSSRRTTPIMNRMHGLWSLGTVAGGLTAAQAARMDVSVQAHLLAVSAVLLVLVAVVNGGLLRTDEVVSDIEPPANSSRRPARTRAISLTLVLILVAGFFSVILEYVSSDWAAFRLTDDFNIREGVAALGYVAFTAGMTTARFAGDWVLSRIGSDRLLQGSLALLVTGLVLSTLVPNPWVSVVGYVLAGFGTATLVPKLYDDAAQYPGRAGAGLTYLTAGVRSASIVGPVLVGTLAATSLSVGSSVAMITLPSALGFIIVSRALR